MTDKIRWGILGGGRIAAKFADALKHVKDAELLAIGSRTIENANAFGDAHNIPRRYGSYQLLAADGDIDIIYIATPHHLHCENAVMCLNAGRHVLCEKPLAVNARQGRAMRDAAGANDRFLMEAMWTRFLPLMDKVRRLFAENAIGDVRILIADFGFRAGDNCNPRLVRPELAGGALLDVGVYTLALSSMLFGKPANIASAASMSTAGIDEQNAMILTFDNGRMSILYSTVQVESPHEAHILGTSGTLRLHRSWWRGNKLSLIRPGKPDEVFELPTHENGFIYEILAAHDDLRNGRTQNALMPLDESLAVLEMMDAIRAQWGLAYPFEAQEGVFS
ncbi:MAG: Gfo/Idh/MocA family oxidoreductase [Planctomycetaceae bacterium]|nr:Gfo/Idh/MocA family oxidoreductase [Planctomycetaceae bacterium]